MKKQFKLGIIGCGETAQTIIKGAVLSEFLHEKKIVVSDDGEENLEKISCLGVRFASDNKVIAENSEYLLIAVSPKKIDDTIKSLGGCINEKIISVAPGIRKNVIKNSFGVNTVKVARCVLNMPCAIGSGVIGIDMNDYNNNTDDLEFLSNLFNCLGTVLSIDESKLDAVTGAGANAAYALMFLDSLVDAGVKQGLTKNESTIIAVQTFIGAAEMVERDEQPISELLMQSCGKGNAAIEAVKYLESKNFRTIVSEAVSVCTQKAKEISEK